MNAEPPKRHSCELCRSRKLKCSGEKSGCSRCAALSLRCRFRAKGAPGRPRKRLATVLPPPRPGHEPWEYQSAQTRPLDQPLPACDIGPLLMEIGSNTFQHELASNENYSGFLEGPACDTVAVSNDVVPQVASKTVDDEQVVPSCECAKDVFDTIRQLKQAPVSHTVLQKLRFGIALFERLITCPVCYDLAKPPRITIQNVLLIGRLMAEVMSGYRHYSQWIKETCTQSTPVRLVYVAPMEEPTSLLSFKVSDSQFQDIVMSGLREDFARIATLGEQFERRQQDRHCIGHETCPNAEGRCWKEENAVDLDPLDICPRNHAAKVLTPCFRIVDEVQSMIKMAQENIG